MDICLQSRRQEEEEEEASKKDWKQQNLNLKLNNRMLIAYK